MEVKRLDYAGVEREERNLLGRCNNEAYLFLVICFFKIYAHSFIFR